MQEREGVGVCGCRREGVYIQERESSERTKNCGQEGMGWDRMGCDGMGEGRDGMVG